MMLGAYSQHVFYRVATVYPPGWQEGGQGVDGGKMAVQKRERMQIFEIGKLESKRQKKPAIV